MKKSAKNAAALLVKAAYSRGGILSKGRLVGYKLLLDHTAAPLSDVIVKVAKLEDLSGEIETSTSGGATVTTDCESVIRAVIGMTSMNVLRTLEFLLTQLKDLKTLRAVSDRYPHAIQRSRDAISLIAALETVHQKWKCVPKAHKGGINSALNELRTRLGEDGFAQIESLNMRTNLGTETHMR